MAHDSVPFAVLVQGAGDLAPLKHLEITLKVVSQRYVSIQVGQHQRLFGGGDGAFESFVGGVGDGKRAQHCGVGAGRVFVRAFGQFCRQFGVSQPGSEQVASNQARLFRAFPSSGSNLSVCFHWSIALANSPR